MDVTVGVMVGLIVAVAVGGIGVLVGGTAVWVETAVGLGVRDGTDVGKSVVAIGDKVGTSDTASPTNGSLSGLGNNKKIGSIIPPTKNAHICHLRLLVIMR